VIFASGGGSNFSSIFYNTLNNQIENSKIKLLVSNNPDCNAVRFAKNNNIKTFIVNNKRYPNNAERVTILKNKLIDQKPSLIALAGYMKLIPGEIVDIFENKIINIHPGKLPNFGGKGFYGINIHRAVVDSGIKSTAVTVHYVNKEYDKGMIIHEEVIDVMNSDTAESLSDRVLKCEHRVYSRVINKILNGKK